MADAHREAAWYHTASIMAAIYEQNRDEKKRGEPFTADDFHPMKQSKKQRVQMLSAEEAHEYGKQFSNRKKK